MNQPPGVPGGYGPGPFEGFPPPAGPYPYAPPPRKPSNTGLFVGLGIGCAVLFFGGVFGAAFWGLQRKIALERANAIRPNEPHDGGGPASSSIRGAPQIPASFTQSYPSSDGLVTAHYPPEFAAKPIAKHSLELAHNLGNGRDEAIAIVIAESPISTDLGEYARVVELAATKELTRSHQYQQTSRDKATCNGVPGVETKGTWQGKTGTIYLRRACAILRDGHGYYFTYSVAQADAPSRLPVLQSIVDATEFHAR